LRARRRDLKLVVFISVFRVIETNVWGVRRMQQAWNRRSSYKTLVRAPERKRAFGGHVHREEIILKLALNNKF
jgi:hypothetical protein